MSVNDPNNPEKNNQMRAVGEADRSPNFIYVRAEILRKVDEMFAELEEAKISQDRPFKFGVAVFGMLGIERQVIQNPLGGFSLMSEKAMTVPGLFVGHDTQDGHDVIFLIRPDKSTVEIRRNALLESLILPEDPATMWEPLPRGVSNADPLVTLTEMQPDGGTVGYTVAASGSVLLQSKEPGRNGMNYSDTIAPQDVESLESAYMLLDIAQQDFFINND